VAPEGGAERSGPVAAVDRAGRWRGVGLARRLDGPQRGGVGSTKSRTGSGASASAMNWCQICAGDDPPVTAIGVLGATIAV
jgi:hypothetical protein